MKERSLIREFLETMYKEPVIDIDTDYSLDSVRHDSSHDIDPDRDGIVNKEDLYSHFDLDNNGVVTTGEYANHVDFHCQYPESLDHYNTLRTKSYDTVPCKNSYDSCSKHLMGNTDDIDRYLTPLMNATGSTCKTSSVQGLLDVLQSLVNCGMLK